jgi:hypothetical protein
VSLDDLLDAGDDDGRGRQGRGTGGGRRSGRRDRGRTAVLAGAAVLAAALVGVGAGALAALLDDGETPGPPVAAGRSSTPPAQAPTTPAPTAAPSAVATVTARPTASVDVPASGTDVGHLVGGGRVEDARVAAELRFDRVQVLTGAEAERAAARDGGEVTGDGYVVNDNPRLRTLQLLRTATVTGDASFGSWAGDGRSGPHPRTLDELLAFVRTQQGKETLFDVRYDRDGFVTAVVERYQP